AGGDADELFALLRHERDALDRLVAHYPDVGRLAAALHGYGGGVGGGADAGEAAGHDGPAIAGAGGVDAQRDGAGLQGAADMDRRGREADRLLADETA